jgi:hypothetical protein
LGVRVVVEDAQDEPVRAGGVGLDADSAGPRAEPGFDGGHAVDHVGDGLPATQGGTGAPAPAVDERGQHV